MCVLENPHDESMETDLVSHTSSLEHFDHTYKDAYVEDESLFLDEFFENDSNHNSEKIFIEEPKFSFNNVKKIVSTSRAPFGKRKIDLSIFTLEDPPTNQSFEKIRIHETPNDQSFEKLFEDKLMCLNESTIDALVSHIPPMKIVDFNFEVIF